MLFEFNLVKLEFFLQLIIHHLIPHSLLVLSLDFNQLYFIHCITIFVSEAQKVMNFKPRAERVILERRVLVE